MTDLFWMTDAAITELNASIDLNLERYRRGDFKDMAISQSWCRKRLLEYDGSVFAKLAGDSGNDLEDSLIIFEQLCSLEPRLAGCRNVWIRLAHTELLEYGRKRWLQPHNNLDNNKLKDLIKKHFFKGDRTGCRDDNVAGRPWWSGYIGSRIAGSKDPKAIRAVLEPLMRTTDTRQSVIERPGIFSERKLAQHIAEYVSQGRYTEANQEKVFRKFMTSINIMSNGLYFGDMDQAEIFTFLDKCKNISK